MFLFEWDEKICLSISAEESDSSIEYVVSSGRRIL